MDFSQIQSISHSRKNSHTATQSTSLRNELSLNEIQDIRKQFEVESESLQTTLTKEQHHSLLITMYEGTGKFLHQKINPFDVQTYLQDLKKIANELHQRGVSLEEFNLGLLRRSQDQVFSLLSHT